MWRRFTYTPETKVVIDREVFLGFFKKIRKVASVATLGLSEAAIGGADKLLEAGQSALTGNAAEIAKGASEAQARAAEQAALARQQAEQQAQQLQLMQANFQTDLKGENLNTVIAGGTANMASAETEAKKRQKSSGLSSTLGLG